MEDGAFMWFLWRENNNRNFEDHEDMKSLFFNTLYL